MHSHLIHIILNALFFGALAIFLGFIIDYIFSNPEDNESTLTLFILIMLQIVITAVIIYYVDFIYEKVIGIDSDDYFGFTMFTVIFFLVQEQLFDRLSIFYRRITGQNI